MGFNWIPKECPLGLDTGDGSCPCVIWEPGTRPTPPCFSHRARRLSTETMGGHDKGDHGPCSGACVHPGHAAAT